MSFIKWKIVLGGACENKDGTPKVRYGHYKTAEKAKLAMESKTNRVFDIYKCEECGKYHIGNSWGEIK